MQKETIAENLSNFIHTLRYEDIPEECTHIAKRCFIDGIGVILAGSDDSYATACRKYALSIGGKAEASFIGKDSAKVPAHLAALANGTAGHVLDWDDTALSKEADRSVLLHPTMQPLAALLALGEAHPRPGKDILTAFIVGFEISCKIAEAIHPDHFSQFRGFHTSGTIGVFGATAAAAKYLNLSLEQTCNALGLTASMAAGIGVNHGTSGKPLHMGRSAENGIVAAKLAQCGMDARPEAFEGTRGFFQCFGGGFDSEKINGRLGMPFAVIEPGVCIKPYPSGVVGHPGMDAMKKLVTVNNIKADDINHVKVFTGTNVVPPGPLRFSFANSGLEGKFSVQFQMASMIASCKAGMMEFTDEYVTSPQIADLQKKIETIVDSEIESLGKGKIRFRLEVELKDGRTLTEVSEEHYRGGPQNPLTKEDLTGKFIDASQKVLTPNQGESVVELIYSIDQANDLSGILNVIAH